MNREEIKQRIAEIEKKYNIKTEYNEEEFENAKKEYYERLIKEAEDMQVKFAKLKSF